MRHISAFIFCLGTFFAVAISTTAAFAAETTAAESKAKKKANDGTKDRAFSIPKEITLTSEQQEKLDGIKKEQAPKVAALNAKISTVLTDDQKAARKTAAAKAKSDGLSRKDRAAVIADAIKLTDDQKKQQGGLQSEMRTVRLGIMGQIYDVLTPEQREYYKLPKSKKSA